jgi:site-specific recombinase XerD
MALKPYRRHRKECEGGHPEDARSGEFEEGRRGWKKCACLIHVSGTLGGRFSRKQTGKSDWDEARAVAAQWESAKCWDGPIGFIKEVVGTDTARDDKRISINDATSAFIASRKNRGLEASTLSKYQTSVKQLRAYCDSRGYVLLSQLTVADMDRFYASWKDGKRAGAKKLERLKGFVKFCLKRKWLTEDITEDLQAQEGSSIPANKMPFTDAEMDRIYAACDSLGGPTAQGPGHRNWSGEDVKDFIMLSIYTGLRISDVATFDITQRLKGNDVFLRMHKTKKELYTWIPDWLVARLRARNEEHGALIFRTGESLVMRTMAELWRVKLGKVFKLAGHFDEPAMPHRFRHTFVRILLEKGVPVADVAELIGDTEEVVRKHYARWVPERQARLTKILKEAFENKPRLVVMKERKTK